MNINNDDVILTDCSRLITAALAKAGADVFIGYPITPANLLYLYASKRFPTFMAAPDEITTVQWMTGFAAVGRLPVTATSFPGYALMIEGINMAYMMELPMVIVLVQRLGPATGTATCGAQGDISMLHGMISGGLSIPVISVSNSDDCWELSAKAMKTAVDLRTPVILLTSKEEVMTLSSFDIDKLSEISPVDKNFFDEEETYKPYKANENLVPPFLPVTNTKHQVRITASTHDTNGIIQNTSKEALDNSKRLDDKMIKNLSSYTFYELDEQPEAETIIISFGITSQAAKEAVREIRGKGIGYNGIRVSHLIVKTMFPIPPEYFDITARYKNIIVAEENYTGQYRHLLFGANHPENIKGVNEFGKMIDPKQIIEVVMQIKG